jgi:DNA polymerase-3 subunit gamma/tau
MTDVPFVSLYRRFRPGRFDELKGQDHVVRALQTAVRDDRVSHAYLFSGPRGTGKTSSARILAKALNCAAPVDGEPCGICTSCTEITQGTSLDVHELDAASNNGVDAIRDLVAHAALGTPGRWKVYIVDEVHMLSTPAANALLKTLEEPPAHVVFVLATTDPQKVPATIRSRTQHLEFRLLGADTLHHLLQSVTQEAGLDLDDESVQAAVRRGRGSARDALSALEQVAAAGSADSARPELAAALSAIADGEATALLVQLSALLASGWSPQQLATELVDDLRQVFLAVLAPELCTVTGTVQEQSAAMAEQMGLPRVVRTMEALGQALIDMRDAPDAQVVLEIALVRSARPDLDAGIEALADRVSVLEQSLLSTPRSPRAEPAPPPPRAQPEADPPTPTPTPTPTPMPTPTPPTHTPPPTPSTPPADVGRKPSLGALRRQRSDDSTPAPASEEPDREEPKAVAAPRDPSRPSALTIDRDSLTQAWGDGILRQLPARAKALFSAGRFVSCDDAVATFALPNVAHRERCEEMVPQVAAALTDHFGSQVRLVLVAETTESTSPSRTASPAPGGPIADEVEDDDAEVLRSAAPADTDQATAAEARLLKAFPGASEVAG